jgi:ABC-type lipoprotein export system ATPase subunit
VQSLFKDKQGVILIVGSSGSGKSTLLKSLDSTVLNIDHDKSIIEQFSSVEEGERLLIAVGLRSIPTWFRPVNTLSNG